MALIRPRLTDYHQLSVAQTDIDFAIPLLNEDIPLYVDPFLLWRSPSQQDQALHTSLTNSFNYHNWLLKKGRSSEAEDNLILASECDEVGLGLSSVKRGKRIGRATAQDVLKLFEHIPEYSNNGFTHFEAIQLFVDGISKDRISDIACNFLKSFLIDFTFEECRRVGIPTSDVTLLSLFDYRQQTFKRDVKTELPVHPDNGLPIIFVPKRWLRHVPWISFDDYFAAHCPKDDVVNKQGSDDRIRVLTYNRHNYGVVLDYVRAKERTAADCHADPLFRQLPIISAKRALKKIKALPTGKTAGADKEYEESAGQLLASLLYPDLDFADMQVRTESGSTIRDVVFYNNRSVDFLGEILKDYNSRQIVMELKNVAAIEREHLQQLNRYLSAEFGSFGVLVTRHNLPKAMLRSTIDLWSGQRRCIISLTDADLELMVEVYESKQRKPVDVLKRSYIDFRRKCPS